MTDKIKILVLPGDGVGPEVTLEARKILNKISDIYKLDIDIDEALFGGVAVDKFDNPYPEDTKNKVKESDAILLGAVGDKKYDVLPKEKKPESGLLELRKQLNLFINIRPIISFPELANSSSIKSEYISNLDIVIIRELVSGLYFGEPRGFTNNNTEAFNTMRYSVSEIERISEYAFKLANSRSKKLCSIDKANVLEVSQLWRSTVNKISKKYTNVELSHLYVDNAAMQLVQNPKQFDVLVTENLFGDILSDIASVLTGSIGMLPSASINENNFGVYEPIHGSAPDIAGQNVVNPIATILSVAMMFQHTFNRVDIYNNILNAVKLVLKEKKFTKDIAINDKYVSTESMGNFIVEKLTGNTNE